MGTLTRKEMEQVIQSGGSVLWKGQVLMHLSQLPSEADLAAGDPAQEAAVAAALDAQISALTAQRARLDLANQSPTIGPRPRAAPAADHALAEVVGQETADHLRAAGYDSPGAVARASDEQLLAVESVGPATLKKLRAAVRE